VEQHLFTAFALNGELDLNRLAAKLGMSRRFRWEEPMKLNPATFAPAVAGAPEAVYLYYFGGLVFRNCNADLISRFLDGLPHHADFLKEQRPLTFHEEYRLEVDPQRQPTVTDVVAVMPRCNQIFLDIVCFVIAKSVALERIEDRIDGVFDDVETLIAKLDRGKLELPDKDLARLASSILSFKLHSIAHIMVLEKPDITWDNADADNFYDTMAGLFELKQRYQEIKHKSETLLDMTHVFTSLSHAKRAARLEWIIIVLIAIEILLYVGEMITGH